MHYIPHIENKPMEDDCTTPKRENKRGRIETESTLPSTLTRKQKEVKRYTTRQTDRETEQQSGRQSNRLADRLTIALDQTHWNYSIIPL